METLAGVLDAVMALGGTFGFGLLVCSAWLACTGGQEFPQDGKGRLAWRHLHRARQAPRWQPSPASARLSRGS